MEITWVGDYPDGHKREVLDKMSRLADEVASEHDRRMLLMAFDIVSRIEMQVWE